MPGFYPPPPVAEAGSESIDRDLSCRKCQYNLRGLTDDAKCPECGSPVLLSICGDLIRYSDPVWIARLDRGTIWIVWSTLLLISWFLTNYVYKTQHSLDPLIPALLLLAWGACNAVGYWYLTTPDPGGLGEANYGTFRRISRVCIFFNAVQQIWSVLGLKAHFPSDVYSLILIAYATCSLAGAIGFISLLHYLSKLLQRLPDQKLEARARWLKYALGTPLILIVVVQAINEFQLRNLRKSTRVDLSVIGGVSILAMLIFGIYYLLLMDRLGRRLVAEGAIASATWNIKP